MFRLNLQQQINIETPFHLHPILQTQCRALALELPIDWYRTAEAGRPDLA